MHTVFIAGVGTTSCSTAPDTIHISAIDLDQVGPQERVRGLEMGKAMTTTGTSTLRAVGTSTLWAVANAKEPETARVGIIVK